MIKEEKLELFDHFALVSKCPLEAAKTRSILQLVIKTIEKIPTQFIELNFYPEQLQDYCQEKKAELSELDCSTDLAGKIWSNKLEEPNARILNKLCRFQGNLMITEFFESCTQNYVEEIVVALDEVANIERQETEEVFTIYRQFLNFYQEQIEGIKQLVQVELKQLEGLQNV